MQNRIRDLSPIYMHWRCLFYIVANSQAIFGVGGHGRSKHCRDSHRSDYDSGGSYGLHVEVVK